MDRAKAQIEQPTPELKPLPANLGRSKGENSKFSKAHGPHSIEHGLFTRMRLKAYTGAQPSCNRNDLTRSAQHCTRSVHSPTNALNSRARSVYDKTPPSAHGHRPPFNVSPHGHHISFSTRVPLLNTQSLSLHPDRVRSRVTDTLAIPSPSSHPLLSLATKTSPPRTTLHCRSPYHTPLQNSGPRELGQYSPLLLLHRLCTACAETLTAHGPFTIPHGPCT